MITMIACVDKNMGIGKDNKLLAHLPKDLNHFKETTLGQICVFGRNTYESLPKKPLPNRANVVLTRDKNAIYIGCKVVRHLDAIIRLSKIYNVFICGGENVYKQFMPYADELIISHMDADLEADTFFPNIDEYQWIPSEPTKVEDTINFKIIKYRRELTNHDTI
ncbi:dihydrofolate reductase [Bacillus wiedmannii]|uniref:dihydrofolate reductase n=1 Tax=Bacillus wiedmannii TaxID=1890302 RepID=UPI0012489201|nr:dihydrofolate reductase [Bacillus wiedmannii]